MFRSLDTIATGLQAQQTSMDVIANNLSNVSTTGFKAGLAEFQSLIYQQGIQPGANSTGATNYPSGLELGTGVKVASVENNMSQGNLTKTSNPLNLAIQGSGFFEILQPDGQTAYTRDGSFELSNTGQLVTTSGYQVVPSITIPASATGVTIGTDGTVSITMPGTSTATTVGQIQLANFVNPQGLQPLGGNLLAQTTASGGPVTGAPGTNGLGSINQGYLEASNVSVVTEMVNMIAAERGYELDTKVATSVNNQLGYLAQM